MKVYEKHFHTIWIDENDASVVKIIDQRKLPFEFELVDLKSAEDAFMAIKDMIVRGAPLIGVTAAYGLYLASLRLTPTDDGKKILQEVSDYLKGARPTAVNLANLLDEMMASIHNCETSDILSIQQVALNEANKLKNLEIEYSHKIGEFGLKEIRAIKEKIGDRRLNILTHCNAGWLACVDYGTATAPIYKAFEAGIDIHVYVDETRPRNQGARLTAWELAQEGVPHTVIPDNTGGHLMQHGMVDMVIVGTDRVSLNGDVANKIGTYLKALAAKDNNIPFFVALPSTTIDFSIYDGVKEIPIEVRDGHEIRFMSGKVDGKIKDVQVVPNENPVINYGFDVTPARLVTALITERGVCKASEQGIRSLFPE